MNETTEVLLTIGIIIIELGCIVALGWVLYWLRSRCEWIRRIAP